MIPLINTIHADIANRLLGIFFDIDETFTTHGKIHSAAFRGLWKLKDAGLHVVPITGRSAGWCDHIAHMWPVDGIVGENGGFYFWFDEAERKLKKRFFETEDIRAERRQRLALIQDEILVSVPGTAVASDQHYRETDLAVDYCEDVKPLDRSAVDRICEIFRKHGATCKVSSIHVNGWFGNYDKVGMTKIFAQDRWGLDLDVDKDRYLFCGDSPNDEPMFQYFPYTAGVKNIVNFAENMTYLPAFVATQSGGEGFTEIVEAILKLRTK